MAAIDTRRAAAGNINLSQPVSTSFKANIITTDRQQHTPRRRRSTLGLAAAALLSWCLVYPLLSSTGPYRDDGIDYDHHVPGHRFLLQEQEAKPGTTSGNARSGDIASAGRLPPPPDRQHNVSGYDVDGVLLAARAFQRELFFFMYDSGADEFFVVHKVPECDEGCERAYVVAPVIAFALRKNYPQRFQGAESGDLLFLLSVGDMPTVRRPCMFEDSQYCKSGGWAPVLQFGSVMTDPAYMPTVVAMPQSQRPHIPCFHEFQITGRVCLDLRPRTEVDGDAGDDQDGQDLGTGQHLQKGLVFGQELGLLDSPDYWDDLIPRIVWRGTDSPFLPTLFPDMRAPTYQEDIAPAEDKFGQSELHSAEWHRIRGGIDALWAMGDDKLTPRWRGVLLTSEARLEARELQERGRGATRWADIRFASRDVDGGRVPANLDGELKRLREYGIEAIGNGMGASELARHRYHIDLGGPSGTSSAGTLERLALPGLLFHHVTPTKDWIHDRLEPWVHYVPVRSDLGDLKEKFKWAESHPQEARRIAEAGTKFARWVGSREGFAQLYQEHVVEPLGNVIAGYQNPRQKYQGSKVSDIVREAGRGEFSVVARCGGWMAEAGGCKYTRNDGEAPATA